MLKAPVAGRRLPCHSHVTLTARDTCKCDALRQTCDRGRQLDACIGEGQRGAADSCHGCRPIIRQHISSQPHRKGELPTPGHHTCKCAFRMGRVLWEQVAESISAFRETAGQMSQLQRSAIMRCFAANHALHVCSWPMVVTYLTEPSAGACLPRPLLSSYHQSSLSSAWHLGQWVFPHVP